MSLDLSSYEPTNNTTAQAPAITNAFVAIQNFVNSLPIANLAGYPTDATKFLRGDGSWAQPTAPAAPPYVLTPFVGAANTSTLTANAAVLIPVYVPAAFTITKLRLHVGVQSGNIDVGVYDTNLAKLVAAGSTACPATGHQTVTLASTVIPAGTAYLVLVADNATAAFVVSSAATAAGLTGLALSKATSFPLPSSLSGASDASTGGFNFALGIFA